MKLQRAAFYDAVRESLFGGSLTQRQVEGIEAILDLVETTSAFTDPRHLARVFAETHWETGRAMYPVEEVGKGAGHPYGKPAGPFGKVYYGRGGIQLTWHENYVRADKEFGWTGDDSIERNPELMLDPRRSAAVTIVGMAQGWFRKKKLEDYFDHDSDDPFNAREIINGDKAKVLKWSGGKNIGTLVADAHAKFLKAIIPALLKEVEEPVSGPVVTVIVPRGVRVEIQERD